MTTQRPCDWGFRYDLSRESNQFSANDAFQLVASWRKMPRTAMSQPDLVLASSSVYRKALLERLGIPFQAISPDVDEKPLPGEEASDLVRRLSRLKAEALAGRFAGSLIIGADQCACLNGQIMGKPASHQAAVDQLTAASGKSVIFRSGICLLDTRNNQAEVDEILFEVRFRPLTAGQIERYLRRDKPYSCAGSIRSEALGIVLFKTMRGDDPTALMGLPLIRLTDMLAKAGVELP